MSYCRNCGAEIPEGAKFCAQCGTPVSDVQMSGPDTDGTGKDTAENGSSTVISENASVETDGNGDQQTQDQNDTQEDTPNKGGRFTAVLRSAKWIILAGFIVGVAASVVGLGAASGDLPFQQEQSQQEAKQKNKNQSKKSGGSGKNTSKKSEKNTSDNSKKSGKNTSGKSKSSKKTALKKAKEKASKKTADEAYQEFMKTDPTISAATDASYLEAQVEGYDYGPLLLVYREHDYDENTDDDDEEAFAAYYYNNGDYGDDTIGQVVQITNEDESGFENLNVIEGNDLNNLVLRHFPDINTFCQSMIAPEYDSSHKLLWTFYAEDYANDSPYTIFYKFDYSANGKASLKLDRVLQDHYSDSNDSVALLWKADGTKQQMNKDEYESYFSFYNNPPTPQPVPKN